MKHDQSDSAADGSHVFDQTNVLVDLGDRKPAQTDDGGRDRAVSGIAMLSTQKP